MMRTLNYSALNPILFRCDLGDGIGLTVNVYLKGTFDVSVSDESRYEEGLINDSLLKKSFEAHLIGAAYEAGTKLSTPEQLKERVPEILAQIRRESAEMWHRTGMEISGMTISEVEIAPGDRRMLEECKNKRKLTDMISSHETPARYQSPPPPGLGIPVAAFVGAPDGSGAKKWVCSCGKENAGRFCTECGSPRDWICECGRTNSGKFCTECGRKRR